MIVTNSICAPEEKLQPSSYVNCLMNPANWRGGLMIDQSATNWNQVGPVNKVAEQRSIVGT